ncbi:MAG: hypothetical protein JRJ02_12225 [Deltaproteobacteria bacterium]|nr:hypothetical protein [Deltaproteobacteria bacterium]
MMKKWFLVLIIALALCFPASASAVTKEGTIQGLFSVCEGATCTPGEEMLVAAMEEIFVLHTSAGESYLLPNIKSNALSRFINKMVRVEGDIKLQGKAIIVNKAEVYEKGKWKTFYSKAMAEQAMKDLYHPMP